MINQQLLDYIRQQLAGGVSKEDTVKALLSNGWAVQDINSSFAIIEKAIPATMVPAPVSYAPAPAATQPSTFLEETVPKPASVRIFEVLIYISIIVSTTMPFLKYGQLFTSQYQYLSAYMVIMVFLLPASLIIGRLVLVFFAARRRANWARIVLLVLFLTNFIGLLSIVSIFSSNPMLALLSLSPILLEAAAFGFAFSRSANRWFEPAGYVASSPLDTGVENTTWSKGIPRTNIGFMIVSLLLVFGLDLVILINEMDLLPFWLAMLVVLAVFGVFFYRENRVLNRRFVNSRSTLDKWIVTLVVIRNIIFVLNFIPFIQIGGAMILVFGGIPYLIVYFILLSKRSKIA